MKNDPEQPASKQQTAESAGQFSLDQRTTALLQAFVRATARHQHESVTFSEDATVAHLAMELARLRDAKEPIAFLPEAAKLLIEARNALAEERRRPLGDNLTAAELTKHTIENLKANRVPWEKICRPGKRLGSTAEQDEFEEISYEGADGEGSFRWKVYTTPDGFEELLKKHWKEHLLIEYEDAADSVRENPPAGEGADEWGAKVEALLDRRGLFYDQTCRERLRLVRNLHNFESYVEFWLERAASKVWKRFLGRATGGGMDCATLYSLYLTRTAAASQRSKSGAATKLDNSAGEQGPQSPR